MMRPCVHFCLYFEMSLPNSASRCSQMPLDAPKMPSDAPQMLFGVFRWSHIYIYIYIHIIYVYIYTHILCTAQTGPFWRRCACRLFVCLPLRAHAPLCASPVAMAEEPPKRRLRKAGEPEEWDKSTWKESPVDLPRELEKAARTPNTRCSASQS